MTQEKKEIGRFFKHSYIYAIGNVINRIGAFLLLPVYTSYLTVTEYGALELFYGVSAVIFGFLSIGIAHATLRFYFDYDEVSEQQAVVSTNFIASLGISIIGGLLVAVWSHQLSEMVFSSDLYANGIYIILGTIVFELSSQVCLAYIRAIEKSLFFVYIAIAKLVIQVGLNVFLVIFLNKGVEAILFGNFIAVLVGWLILSYYTISRCGLRFHYKKLITILHYSFPFLLGTVTALISSNVDKFSLNYIETLGAVGIYMLARKFSMVIEQLIGEPFSRSYGSFRFSIMKNSNAPKIQANITKYLFYATLFIALAICLFIDDLLRVISKEEFRAAGTFVPIIMISSLLKIMNYPFQTGILYKKKTKYFFYIGSVSAAISICGNLLLIPIIGIYGACITLITTDLISIILMHLKSQQYFKVDYHFNKMFLAFIFAVLLYLTSYFTNIEIVSVMILIKLLLLSLFVLALLKSRLFLSDDEKADFNHFIGKLIPQSNS